MFGCKNCLTPQVQFWAIVFTSYTATPEDDFQLDQEEVEFAVGEKIHSLELIVNDDEWAETKEELSIRLLSDGDLLLGSSSSVINIIDNDC